MNITLLISSLSCGGAERVVCNLANYLAAQNHDVDVLMVSDLITYKTEEKVNVIPMYPAKNSKLPKSIINLFRIYNFNKYLRKKKRDLYVSFLPELTYMLMRQRFFFNSPIIIAERGDPKAFWEKSASKIKKFRKYFSKAKGYVFQTEDAKKYYASQGIDVSNSTIIPNAINPLFVRPKYQGKKDKSIISVGRLVSQKNFSLLLKAFSSVSKEFPEFRLKIFGDGDLLSQLQKEADDLGVKEKVIFGGYVNNIVDQMEESTLFVLSSNFEGMPNALAEAMALGLPCVSTDCPVGGPRFLINSGYNGLLVPINNEEAMASSIKTLLKDNILREKISDNARKIVDVLNADRIYSDWEKFLLSTIEN